MINHVTFEEKLFSCFKQLFSIQKIILNNCYTIAFTIVSNLLGFFIKI